LARQKRHARRLRQKRAQQQRGDGGVEQHANHIHRGELGELAGARLLVADAKVQRRFQMKLLMVAVPDEMIFVTTRRRLRGARARL
jgi:hypothetical protein